MSIKGADQVTVNDNTHTNAGSDQTGHNLLAASGAYAPPTDGKSTATASSGSSWHTAGGFLNLVTGEVFTSNKTPAELHTELSNASTATTSLGNAREDFIMGNNNVGIEDLQTAKKAMDSDPNMSRQALHLDFDLALTQASSYIPFFGASLTEHFGQNAAAIEQSTAKVGQDIGQSLSRRVTAS